MKNAVKNSLKEYAEKNNLCELKNNEELYLTSVEVVLDAVLSINRKYYQFVVPRIQYFQENYSHIRTLKSLRSLIHDEEVKFEKVWLYRHPARLETLKSLVDKFLEIIGEDNDLDALKKWAEDATYEDYANFRVKGIGIATFQYLRILLGADTIKPDVHIKRFVEELSGTKKMNDRNIIKIFDEIKKEIPISLRMFDKHIWDLLASNATSTDYFFKNGVWIKKTVI